MYTVHYRDPDNLTQSQTFRHRWEALEFASRQRADGRPAYVTCPHGAAVSLCCECSDLA